MMLPLRGVPAWILLCACLLCACLMPSQAHAQSPTLPSLEDLSYRPLSEALLAFQGATGLDLSYDPRLVAHKWTRAVVATDETPEAYLEGLLEGTNLTFYRLSSGTYAIQEQTTRKDEKGSLIGFIFDYASGSPIAEANVRLIDANNQGAAANANGLFYFKSLSPGTYQLQVSHIGYEPVFQHTTVGAGEQTSLTIHLKPEITPLNPIIVEGDLPPFENLRVLQNTDPVLPMAQANALGTADAVRGMNNLPGVRVGDALADVHIQGGDPGEHQFRLDGVPVFEPVHLRGLLGAFNPFAIERITIHKAGFAASDGSQLAGVIDAEHALTGNTTYPLDLQADPLSFNARLNLSADFTDEIKGHFMAAYRTSLWDGVWSGLRPSHIDSLLLDWNAADQFLLRASILPLLQEHKEFLEQYEAGIDSLPPPAIPEVQFDDIHAAGRLRFPGGHALFASFYRGSNLLNGRRLITSLDSTSRTLDNPDRYSWMNENAQLRATILPASNMLLTTRLWTTQYNLQHEYLALARPTPVSVAGEDELLILDLRAVDDSNRVRETSLESVLDVTHWGGFLEAGFELTRTSHRFLLDDAFTRKIQLEDTTWRAVFFAEERLTLGSSWTIIAGGRLTYLNADDIVYAEPRLDIRYRLRHTPIGAISLRAAAGIYRQFLNQYDMSNISPSTLFPSIRFWIPTDSTIAPPKAHHLAADIVLQPNDAWTLRVESYYKDQPNLLRIDYPLLWARRPTRRPPIATQDEFLAQGRGYAYGGAAVLAHGNRTARASVRYEYNIARREYTFEDTTRIVDVPWSEPHQLELALDWFPHPRFITTARWRGGWGRSWAFRKAYYDRLGSDPLQQPIFGDYDLRHPEDHLLPSFQQLDLGAAYTQQVGPTSFQIRLDVINALNRINVTDRSLQDIEQDNGSFLYAQQDRPLLARTVSLGLRLRW